MDKKDYLVLLLIATLAWMLGGKALQSRPFAKHASVPAPKSLTHHSLEFEKKVYKVTDGVYSAVGYGLANSIMLEGDDGVTIVDTLENTIVADEVYAEFRKLTSKPVKAIIYTHFHGDHVGGATSFVPGLSPSDFDVYAHNTTMHEVNSFIGEANEIAYKRAMRQFGSLLDRESEHINCGIGPALYVGNGEPVGFIVPTKTFYDRLTITVGGLSMELIHAPGETKDQIVVWVPSKKVLCAADNIYKSFPNIYAIRGTKTRDVGQWISSLDVMRRLNAEYLVPSHTVPKAGAQEISDLLLFYRDAMQYVYDQTIRYMNKGLTPDEIVPLVQLPPHLAQHEYLQPFYGNVPWSVRAIFGAEMGWFSGKSKDLYPMDPVQKARGIVQLAGGWENLKKQATDALAQNRHQWALLLVEHLLTLSKELSLSQDTHTELLTMKVTCLRQLASQQVGATGRNYYLTEANEVEGLSVAVHSKEFRVTVMHPDFDLRIIFISMGSRLDHEKSAGKNITVFFRLHDTQNPNILLLLASIHVRHSVCDISFNDEALQRERPDLILKTSVQTWKEIVVDDRSAVSAFATGDIEIEGDGIPALNFIQFIDLFEPPVRRS